MYFKRAVSARTDGPSLSKLAVMVTTATCRRVRQTLTGLFPGLNVEKFTLSMVLVI